MSPGIVVAPGDSLSTSNVRLLPPGESFNADDLFLNASNNDVSASRESVRDLRASLVLPDELVEQLRSPAPSSYNYSKLAKQRLPEFLLQNHELLEAALRMRRNNRMSRVTFDVYTSHDLFISEHAAEVASDGGDVSDGINSVVVASAVNGYQIKNLTSPVYVTFKLKNVRGSCKTLHVHVVLCH